MDDYLQIRLLHRDGLSARKIARWLRCGRDTIRMALLNTSPPGYVKSAPRACPKLTVTYQAAILAILKEDESAPRKQRQTSMRIFARLRDEQGYAGRYDQVRRFVSQHRKRERETHILLDHPKCRRWSCRRMRSTHASHTSRQPFETVTLKAYLNQIVIVHKGAVAARHLRSRLPGEQVLVPMHYLSVLGRKPAYLNETTLFGQWKLPATFACLRATLEDKHGPRTGARHYIRVLQRLGSHSVGNVESAIIACEHRQALTAEIIAEKLNSLTAHTWNGTASITGEGSPHMAHTIPIVHVPPPDLR